MVLVLLDTQCHQQPVSSPTSSPHSVGNSSNLTWGDSRNIYFTSSTGFVALIRFNDQQENAVKIYPELGRPTETEYMRRKGEHTCKSSTVTEHQFLPASEAQNCCWLSAMI
ncbi:conserved hypothetical protein [Trichinella spiralis]|uniref:hypothetical protein n=1 Tax=Trichinella spiralis TaxID=6334 RepID=UPI0001EFD3B2|nr:conserved hypothetical protein [Trichinella spiralis]